MKTDYGQNCICWWPSNVNNQKCIVNYKDFTSEDRFIKMKITLQSKNVLFCTLSHVTPVALLALVFMYAKLFLSLIKRSEDRKFWLSPLYILHQIRHLLLFTYIVIKPNYLLDILLLFWLKVNTYQCVWLAAVNWTRLACKWCLARRSKQPLNVGYITYSSSH